MSKLDDYPELWDWLDDKQELHVHQYYTDEVFYRTDVEEKLIAMRDEIKLLERKLKRSEPVPVFKMHESVYFDDIKVRITNVKTYCNTCARFLDAPVYTVLVPYHGLAENVPESLLKFEEEL